MLVESKAINLPAGPGQPTSPPGKVLNGKAAALLLNIDPGNGVTSDEARQRVPSQNRSQDPSCLLSSTSSYEYHY